MGEEIIRQGEDQVKWEDGVNSGKEAGTGDYTLEFPFRDYVPG